MHVYGPTQLHGPQSIGGPHNVRNTQAPAKTENTSAIHDSVEISDAARWSNKLAIFPTSGKIASMRSAGKSPTAHTKPRQN